MISGNNLNDAQNVKIQKLYPEAFFTQTYINDHQSKQNELQTQPTNQQFENMFNPNMIKKILPIILSKDKKINIADIISTINPQMAEMMSITESFKKNNKKEPDDTDDTEQSIDISEYTEIK